MRRPVVLVVLAVSLLLALVLGACGSGEEPTPAGGDHNEADVRFATGMVPHHAQALRMVDLAQGRGAGAGLEKLLGDIEEAQRSEIEQMSAWLEGWGEDVPPTDGSMPASGAGTTAGTAMPGMLAESDLQRLESTRGAAFESLWLRLMIQHHEGAVQMARTQVRQGESQDATELAEHVIEAQTEEIELMQQMLRR